MYSVRPAARDFPDQGPRPPGAQERQSLHYANANEAKAELLLGPEIRFPLDLAATAFVDVLIETKKLECLLERGSIFEIGDL
jgi:hypothetical protein